MSLTFPRIFPHARSAMKMTRLLPLLLSLCFAASAVAQQDIVRLRNGNADSGTIESEDYQVLSLKSTKDKKTNRHSWDDIVEVTYGNSVDYLAAIKMVNGGNASGGAAKLLQLAAGEKLRKDLKPNALFFAAAALQRAGNLKDAITNYNELVKAYPKNAHLRNAAKGVVDCRIASGEAEMGLTDLQAIQKTAKDAGVDDLYLGTFEVFAGRLLEAQKKMVEAKLKFELVAANRGISPALTAEAKLGIARCSQAEGQPAKALEIYKQIIDQALGNEVLAGAWNGMGDIARDEASKAKNADKMIDALYMYLRGVVEFAPAPGEGTAEFERAIAGSAAAFKALSELESDAAKKKVWADRSRERLNQLKKEFPNSAYLQGS
jgi:tetratricopeptide (TPR) repeat protein